MIVVHHLETSRSLRILWLLEELGVDYAVERHARDPHTRLAPPGLKAVHPLGKSPVIVDDGRVVAETGLIVEYLCDRYDTTHRLSPAKRTGLDSEERLRWLYWLHYAEGSAMGPLMMKLLMSRLPAEGPAAALQAGFVDPQLALHADFWESELDGAGGFAGPSFSAADVVMSFPVQAAVSRLGAGTRRPNLQAFVERVSARPAYGRALERGGP